MSKTEPPAEGGTPRQHSVMFSEDKATDAASTGSNSPHSKLSHSSDSPGLKRQCSLLHSQGTWVVSTAFASSSPTFDSDSTQERASRDLWGSSRPMSKKTRNKVAEMKARKRQSIFAMQRNESIALESTFQTANNIILVKRGMGSIIYKGKSLVYWLTEAAKQEEKKRNNILEKELDERDNIFIQMDMDLDAIKKEERRLRVQESRDRIMKEQKAERMMNSRRQVLAEEATDRIVIDRVQSRAFRELLSEDIRLRQRMHTLSNVSSKAQARRKEREDWANKSSQMAAGWEHMLSTSLARASKTVSARHDEDVEEHDVTVPYSILHSGDETLLLTDQATPTSSPHRQLHSGAASPSKRRVKLQNDVEAFNEEIHANPRRKPAVRNQFERLNQLRRNLQLDIQRNSTAGSVVNDDPDAENVTEGMVEDSDPQVVFDAIDVLQRVGRGYLLRSGSAAQPPLDLLMEDDVMAFVPGDPADEDVSMPLSPVWSGSRPGSSRASTPAMGYQRPASTSSQRPLLLPPTHGASFTGSDPGTRSVSRCDALLAKVKQRRRKAFPKLTQAEAYLDVASPVKKKIIKAKRKEEAAGEEVELPEHVKLYDAKQSSDAMKHLEENRERLHAQMRNEAWSNQAAIRRQHAARMASYHNRTHSTELRGAITAMQRERQARERHAQAKRKQQADERRKFLAHDEKEIERLELHVNLRQKFMRESRVEALKQSLIEVPGAERIAGMTTNYSYKETATKSSGGMSNASFTNRSLGSTRGGYSPNTSVVLGQRYPDVLVPESSGTNEQLPSRVYDKKIASRAKKQQHQQAVDRNIPQDPDF